jgi:hypothetical protein
VGENSYCELTNPKVSCTVVVMSKRIPYTIKTHGFGGYVVVDDRTQEIVFDGDRDACKAYVLTLKPTEAGEWEGPAECDFDEESAIQRGERSYERNLDRMREMFS